jgi:hypothetical protein
MRRQQSFFFSIGVAAVAALVALTLTMPASAGTGAVSVSGGLTLDTFGNRLDIAARSTADGGATGYAELKDGTSQLNNPNAPQIIRVRITCMIPLSASSVIVGGAVEGSSPGVGTVEPFFSFVLEDGGVGAPDKWTIFEQVSGVCVDAFGPASETAVGGNIVISSG